MGTSGSRVTGPLPVNIWPPDRHATFAGQTLACAAKVTFATEVATGQFNARADPWVGPPTTLARHQRKALTDRT